MKSSYFGYKSIKQASSGHQCDLFYVLCSRHHQTLHLHLRATTKLCIAIAMQLLCIGKTWFYCFFAPRVNDPPLIRESILINTLFAVFSGVPCDCFNLVCTARTTLDEWAVHTYSWIGLIMAIAFSAGRFIDNYLSYWAGILIIFIVISVFALIKISGFICRMTIAHDCVNITNLQILAKGRRKVTRI